MNHERALSSFLCGLLQAEAFSITFGLEPGSRLADSNRRRNPIRAYSNNHPDRPAYLFDDNAATLTLGDGIWAQPLVRSPEGEVYSFTARDNEQINWKGRSSASAQIIVGKRTFNLKPNKPTEIIIKSSRHKRSHTVTATWTPARKSVENKYK